MTKKQSTSKPLFKKILRLILRILLSIFILFIVLVLFIRSPWGQDLIVGKVTDYVSEKIDTPFNIGKLYVTFSGNVSLEELYLEDQSLDTLVYSKYLETNVAVRPLIFGNNIEVDVVEWNGLKANIKRKDTIEGFNFQYIVDAFASSQEAESQQGRSESSENSTQFSLGELTFTDFDLTYTDEVTGMDSELILGQFELESESIDLENMKFHLAQVSLTETNISFIQFKPTPPSEQQEKSTLPWIVIDEFSIEELQLTYNSSPEGIASEVYLDDFHFTDLDANLDKQEVNLDELEWKDSRVKVEIESKSTSEDQTEKLAKSNSSFSWPQWKVNVNEIDFQNQEFEFYQNGKRPTQAEFSAEALAFENFYLKLNELKISKEENLSFNLDDFQFKEASGLVLEEFQMKTQLNSKETSLENLRLQLNNSILYANLKLNYNSLDELIFSPAHSRFKLDVSSLKVDLKDAYIFSPELKNNEQIQNLAQKNLEGNLNAEGDLDKLTVSKFNFNWGKNTQVGLEGSLTQYTDIENLGFDVKNLVAKTNKNDLSQFISEEDLGISFPEIFAITGDFKKNGNDYSTHSQLKSSLGDVELKGFFDANKKIDYDVYVDVISLKLGELLQNDKLGNLNMQLASNGNGNTVYDLTAEFSTKIDSIRFDAYTFSGMSISGDLEKGKGELDFGYSDENLQFDVASDIALDSVSPQIDVKLNLKGIRTKIFNLTSKDLRAKLLANFQFEGNTNDFRFDAQLRDGLVVYDSKPYYLGGVDFSSKVDSSSAIAEIESQFLNGKFNANDNIEGISKALQNHFENYEKDSATIESAERPVNFDLDLSFIDSPIISQVFAEGIQEMDTLQASIQFDEEKNQLTSKLNLPYLNYKDNEITRLGVDVKSNGDKAEFNFGFDKVLAGPFDIAKTNIDGNYEARELNLKLDAFKDGKDFYSSSISVKLEDDELYRISVSPDNLVLNDALWSIPKGNEIVYHNDSILVSNFKLNRNSQKIELTDDLKFDKKHIGIVFDNFKLSSLTSYFNPDEKLAGGLLSGNLVLIEPFISNGLVSNFNIDNLKVTEVALGNLSLKAEAMSNEDYNLNLSLKDAGVDLVVEGVYHTNASESGIDLDIDLQKLELNTIESFASGQLKNSAGNLNGDFEINGPLEDLDYKGYLAFDDVQFNLKTLNTLFHLQDEKIDVSKNKLNFDEFTITDNQENTFSTSGTIAIENITNPDFDLTLNAKDFQLLNSTKDDNDLYYGKLVFDASAKLKGNLDFPEVDLDLTIKEETDLTYIVPESQASIEERDGIVVFVNKENPDDILTKKDDDDLSVVITGIDLKSDIRIQNKSKVKVIFNKRTGDNVTVRGGGDFKFDISRTGRLNLVGKYEVTDGSVELNLYNVVKRKFNIASSSSVKWSGDPYNANLDLRAIYSIETSANSLMATQTAGENSMTQNRYKQQLPFLVYLDVGGELMSPELSFKLDMPDESQGAINGSVYGRISQINQQEDQLNKQVFSLLVLNRFYPESGSDGSQGGPATMARDNINQALSDQLNRFSDKLTGNTGISLNFDVNSYTDYQGSSAQDRTDVDVTAQKKLMDDRLVVEAGSQVNVQGDQRPGESQAVVGNVKVEYLLTKDGRWKLRGFRKSEYENVIDGQVFVSGIALIFTREFNKFKVLWNKEFRESLKEKEYEVEARKEDRKQTEPKSETEKNE